MMHEYIRVHTNVELPLLDVRQLTQGKLPFLHCMSLSASYFCEYYNFWCILWVCGEKRNVEALTTA